MLAGFYRSTLKLHNEQVSLKAASVLSAQGAPKLHEPKYWCKLKGTWMKNKHSLREAITPATIKCTSC